ncbi:TetR/AcrR family transcriptional regulator C-terminal domain-containing protein [Microcella alkalica]|uniref:TetR/AcrR family transcriptional regulator C-terminal domain-containing protein n=1 Tax=Microcella alkalica TaxID=355930 RepID=UPI00145C6703|nr:TetR/AcrR family transcriptional regulator C-terminal domain-containing protein [Microcella alkalica]
MPTSPRAPLSRERILSAALSVADRDGLPALSMRRLGAALGVEAMSLYGHVRDKGDLLDGLVDHVVGMWADPLPDESDWRVVARTTMARAHEVLLARPWACELVAARPTVGRNRLRYAEALQRRMLDAGFSPQLAHHGLHLVDGTIMGFTLQELRRPTLQQLGEEVAAVARGERADEFPAITAVLADSAHDHAAEFALMTELILDGLERLHARETAERRTTDAPS